MTLSGSGGGASPPFRSQPDSGDVSQSRTNCLSKETWLRPGCQDSAGQNRDESGVSTSSASRRTPESSNPSSILVSATMMPRPRGQVGAPLIDGQRDPLQLGGCVLADQGGQL